MARPKPLKIELRAPSQAELAPGGRPAFYDRATIQQAPTSAVAASLARLSRQQADIPIVHLASSERRAEEIGRALGVVADADTFVVLRPWDCLPYDRASPSREVMGQRIAALATLADAAKPTRILVLSPEALVQRLPPSAAWSNALFPLAHGRRLDRIALAKFARRTGYVSDDRIDEPGEIAFHGNVIDVYPPDASAPIRLQLDADDVVTDIRVYDAMTQRSEVSVSSCSLGPASEWIEDDDDGSEPGNGTNFSWERRALGCEHGLAAFYDGLQRIVDLIPSALMTSDAKADGHLQRYQQQIEDAWRTQNDLRAADQAKAPSPSSLYVTGPALKDALGPWTRHELDLYDAEPVPRFFEARSPQRAFRSFIGAALADGQQVIVVGSVDELQTIAPALRRLESINPVAARSWSALDDLSCPALVTLKGDLEGGFVQKARRQVVIAAADVLGSRLARPSGAVSPPLGPSEFRIGDVVLHEDHGVGILRGLKPVAVDTQVADSVELEYHGDTRLLVGIDEFDRLWRYGAEADVVALDRLKGDTWPKRRAAISRYIEETARHLVRLAKVRAAQRCEPIVPPQDRYDAFARRFAYPETVDQLIAIQAVEDDLAAGRPMDRLVCGDVGFGKTEIALRAAAAVVLSGRQAALVAPTTVLARQHFEAFTRRFAGMGINIAHLSRLVSAKEGRRVRTGLADGSIHLVIGTHAVGSRTVTFQDLALMIIDEEQKFGAGAKVSLRKKAQNVHLLAMTATPIPRTLQAAMVGLQDVSVLATAPARRRPIRTFLMPVDHATLATALRRERGRAGQSFVVVPRIEDIAPLQVLLAKIVPDLSVFVAHGDLPPNEVDDVMVGFADGAADVLLATAIIESGLDVPRANTMIVVNPERFGLAQLHQLRGRVGRSRAQGVVYLMNDPDHPLEGPARARLETLLTFDQLGAGLDLSARDMELRGSGSLLGDDQAGHMKLVGTDLYHRLLQRALQAARGHRVTEDVAVSLNLGLTGSIPESYVADPVIRINLYARIARMSSQDDIDAFREEVEDRFGPLPAPATALFAMALLRCLARQAGVREITVGPKATAMTLAPGMLKLAVRALKARKQPVQIKDERLFFDPSDKPDVVRDVEETLRALCGA